MKKVKKVGDARIAVRLAPAELEKLDAKLARMQEEMPAYKLTRSDVVRQAVNEFSEKG